MIDIRTLRAAGLTDEQILKVIEEDQAKVREQTRIRQRNHRARNGDLRDKRDMALTVLLPSSNLPSIDRPLPTAARAKHAKTPLPPDWQPKGEQRDVAEADEFRDHALAKDYRYANWDAAYRNFQKSPYNARNKGGQNGQGRRHGSVLDAFDRLGEKLYAQGATDDYIPGSSGPRPLQLDTQVRSNGLKLVPKG